VLEAAAMGLRVPIVYNTNGYDSVETLKALDGIVSIYLPDIRYADDKPAVKYSQTPDYVTHNRNALKEMYRQVGDLVVDAHGLAQRGLIVRHLILPNDIAGSRESLAWLAQELSPSVTVSIMSQYSPQHKAPQIPSLSRKISAAEYEAVLDLLSDLELDNGWMQEMDAPDNYLPDFEREGHPFDAASVGAIHESPSKGVPQSKKSPATKKAKAEKPSSPRDRRSR
jgi:putative pyruvate formate lyase activating enzyme